MKRLHVHVRVDDLDRSIAFYSALFGAEPDVAKPDYAKWMRDDPRVNFAISTTQGTVGIDHLGIQVDDDAELHDVAGRLTAADQAIVAQKQASCCYAVSDKAWATDPQGVVWETFHSMDHIPVYGADRVPAELRAGGACCDDAVDEPAPGCCA